MYTSYSRTILSKIITSKRCGLLTTWYMLVIIFWLIQKPYHVHLSCWNASGRKLPTAYTSQQLLRWLRPKRYIFPFFLLAKNTEKYVHIDTTHDRMSTLDSMSETCVRNVRNLEFLGPQKSSSEVPKIVLSGHVRKSPEILKSCEILKNHKNRKNRKNLENSEKVHFLALWRLPYATCQNRSPDTKIQISGLFAKSRDFWKSCSGHEISGFARCQKKCENFEFLGPQKNRKSVLYAVGTTRRKWRHISLRGGKKNALFWTFSRVKEKNVPFSAILRVFVISDFF